MSFDWEKYNTGGGIFLTPDEKDAIVKGGQPIGIAGVSYQEAQGQYGPRYIATVVLTDPVTGDEETRKWGFPEKVGDRTSRDNLLQGMMDEYFGAGQTEPLLVTVSKVNNFFKIEKASV